MGYGGINRMRDPHMYVEPSAEQAQDRCGFCGLPEDNKVHNARPVRRNPRTKREEYTDYDNTIR